ncbi:MAG: hypothetical protein JW894_02925 [Bacteroidales bacterium]|nr:hypothetical protein [Bacteroidales bacterium]
MKAKAYLFIVMFLPVVALCQFQAKMLNVIMGKEMNYDGYLDLNNYRYEFEEDDKKGIIIVKPEENKTYIMLPEDKLVHITTCDAAMSRMNDPVQSYQWFVKFGGEAEAGTETIEGFECTIKEAIQQGQKILRVWYSGELNFPVKMENLLSADTYMNLSNVTDWDVNTAYFTVPEDYKEVDEKLRPIIPEPPPPETWIKKEINVPFEGSVEIGTKLYLKINNTANYKVCFSNNADSPAKVIRHLIRNGAELPDNEQGPLSYRTRRLFPEEKKTYTFSWNIGDEVILEIYEGVMDIKIVLE